MQWLRELSFRVLTPATLKLVDATNSRFFASTSLRAFVLRSLSVKRPDDPQYQQPDAGLPLSALLWHCCTLDVLDAEFPMAQLLSAEMAAELEVDGEGPCPAHTSCVNIFLDCFIKSDLSASTLQAIVCTSVTLRVD